MIITSAFCPNLWIEDLFMILDLDKGLTISFFVTPDRIMRKRKTRTLQTHSIPLMKRASCYNSPSFKSTKTLNQKERVSKFSLCRT